MRNFQVVLIVLPIISSGFFLQSCGDVADSTVNAIRTEKDNDTYIGIIDLSAGGVEPIVNSQENSPISTAAFARDKKLDIAINTSFFDSRNRPLGFTKSNNKVWTNSYEESFRNREMGIFYCTKTPQWRCGIQMDYSSAGPAGATFAMTGYLKLVKNGMVVKGNDSGHRARTAVGVSMDGKTIIIAAVPEGHRDGNLNLLAEKLHAAGAHNAINFDGGGSTALIKKSDNGINAIINSSRTPPVHLGFKKIR